MAKQHLGMKLLAAFYRVVNRFTPWHKLPYRMLPHFSLRLWNLPSLREDLRRWNLYDAASLPSRPEPPGYEAPLGPAGKPMDNPFRSPAPFDPDAQRCRRADGSYNDLEKPNMGSLSSRYGRNFPFEASYPVAWRTEEKRFCPVSGIAETENERPTPREISNTLMVRHSFIAAESLNLLAGAWIQFQVHDWARHIADRCSRHRLQIPLSAGDTWPQRTPANTMEVDRTLPDETRPEGCTAGPPTFLADGTMWWDGSQIYGGDQARQQELRSLSGGHLTLTPKNRLPDTPDPMSGIDLTGFMGGWWAGLSLLHTLFVREHNAICDMLAAKHPTWSGDDERLFQTARLINAALIAKIHTVEWTPAILGQPVLKIGMNANWWGLFGEQIRKRFGKVIDNEALGGIPGSPTDHHGVPFSLTEEFVSVYRLHPLIPDEYRIHSLDQADDRGYFTFDDIQGRHTRRALDRLGMENVLYSFGLAHPGAVTLHNYPHFLRQYHPPDQPDRMFDVATIDVLRDRERGVPRYNRFRELLRMPRVRTFDELNPRWAKEMADLYDNNIDRVDTMVGLLGEQAPDGFGFSDTAFRIFILMASRRLKSDRFFTTDYCEDVYTKAGLAWIDDNGFGSVLLRHYPALGPALHGLENPFHPWRNVHP